MIKYNICFIRRGDRILLLNRELPSWMGCWNGVGGKLEPGESPRDSMAREIAEETGITACRITYKGLVTWTSDGGRFGGMYLYLGELPDTYEYPTPIKTPEGILDWKKIDWILHPDNVGVTSNLPVFLRAVLEDPRCYDHHVAYRDGRLAEHRSVVIVPDTETLAGTEAYLRLRGEVPTGG
ncbi:NUDIX domain-containing protein [Cohnella zeiphila]|uniref:8-oxo-dGTP diphosphatase n=1 Tax=Cohnella zeiphila TaxID=2761120 RepID=A0A7X0VWZ6_9BACL|nr:8-oxo-dGTP diphosphatase [Cohnella zeiphila]